MNGIKGIPRTLVKTFVGPPPIYRRRKFWVGIGMVGISGGAIAFGLGWQTLEETLPESTDDVLTYIRDETITVKAADGTILQQIGPATHDNLKIWEIPDKLKQAFISIEDQRFEKHSGLDYQGIVRAAFSNLLARDVVEGGSTITQQLARIVYFDQQQTLGRKLKEMRMAQKIEQDLEKDQILERYLNLVYLGSGAYGVADAAWVYFSKPVTELTLAEMATLAALPPAPSEYSPFINKEIAQERRNVVLRRMQKNGYITEGEADAAIATPLRTKRSNPKRLDRQASYFTEYIQQELPKYVPPDVLGKKGLIVETTLNPQWQVAAEAAVAETIETYGKYQRFEQAALVAIDPRNGQIKAMVGGKEFLDQQFNRVTQAQRQPGSTFKTFVYTTAIAAGFSPYQSYQDAPFVVDGYEPKNYSENFRGWTSIRDALTHSVNIVAVKTLIKVGWDPVVEIAEKMGIESPLNKTYSLALGASEVNLLELTSAYGTLATQGVHVHPHGIRRILDRQGKVIYREQIQRERAIDEDTAAIMTWMLRNVVTSGTGGNAQLRDRAVAGKTGTSDESRDLWFIGYIPQLVTGVWLGNDDNKPTWGASSTAAIAWREFMEEAVENMRAEDFPDRPNKLDGREGTIEAKPIEPKKTYTKKTNQTRSSRRRTSRRAATTRRSTSRSTSRSYSPRRSTSSRSRTRSQPAPARSSRRQAPVRNTAPSNPPPRRSAPAPKPAPPAPAPAPAQPAAVSAPPAPAPAPAPVAPPPAPPASRKAAPAPAPAAPAPAPVTAPPASEE
ncbi:MAG: penicillin-binding protein 1A [Coleofasciculus sp. C1-SOL-03]|uniref:transglycosylase domain-containing protein n=1 Tax=Coleofasciculus sp. C1-SOL-03 TaxID=3069522 RepID=UPI0032FC5128